MNFIVTWIGYAIFSMISSYLIDNQKYGDALLTVMQAVFVLAIYLKENQ